MFSSYMILAIFWNSKQVSCRFEVRLFDIRDKNLRIRQKFFYHDYMPGPEAPRSYHQHRRIIKSPHVLECCDAHRVAGGLSAGDRINLREQTEVASFFKYVLRYLMDVL